MKIGDVFEVAECANCEREIVNTYWGGGGTIWTHRDTDGTFCYKPSHAYPAQDSIRTVE